MRLTKRHRAALTAALIGTALGVTPLTTANAAAVAMTLHTSDTIDTVGTPEDIDITLTTPPSADSFVELNLNTKGAEHLTITDDTGTVLTPDPVYANDSLATFRFGKEDSDHDGIPGATLTPGSLHVRVTADGYVGGYLNINADYIDGATGNRLPIIPAHALINIKQPSVNPYWQSPSWSTLAAGAQQPVECRLDTHMRLQTPPASTRTRLLFTAQQITKSGYTASQLARSVHVQHSDDGNTYNTRPWTIGADGSLYLEIAKQDWTEGTLKTSDYLRFTAAWGLPAGHLTGIFQTLDPDGTQLSNTPQTLDFTADRAAFYGRDSAGVLWQYQASTTSDPARYTRRAKVGGGWNTYNDLAKLSTLKADGTGDLVARDKAGILWLYKATGDVSRPFAARSKVGGGWNTYTQLTGPGDITGDRKADLIARDRDGVLWLYRGTDSASTPFTARTRIGAGWNAYDQLTGGADLTGDSKADLIARDRDGVLWFYRGTSSIKSPFASRTRVGGGWNTYTRLVSTGDTTGDGINDLIATDSSGTLWLYRGTSTIKSPFTSRTRIGSGWTIYNTLT
ncbi:tachylectin-related carbohydrate-binding protein [Streptomyces sp. NPDC005786]|uniref:tachylectin-related carbohydrate-binding protein n=1 Tax=Streptomyces sp. NPDC005786 TaxID=3154891 RepID=UPI0033DA0143